MEKSLSLPNKLALSFLTSLTCHLQWWLQRLSPLSCYCLHVTAQLWPLASLAVYSGPWGLSPSLICWPSLLLPSGMLLAWPWRTWEERVSTSPHTTYFMACARSQWRQSPFSSITGLAQAAVIAEGFPTNAKHCMGQR